MVCHLVCPVVNLSVSSSSQQTASLGPTFRAKERTSEGACLGGAPTNAPSRPCCCTPRRETPGAWASGGVPDVRIRALPVRGYIVYSRGVMCTKAVGKTVNGLFGQEAIV